MNRLVSEKSPYLLQHAHNPVDWYPWGDEAFARARAEEKPIFLSVGYSTCHWCHVMERESFENRAVAAVLEREYVAIKVDREERPDVDRVYMTFVQVTTGSGGWPMSVWLTPGLQPIYGGTYFPPTSRWGRPGFVEILLEIARLWREERGRVLEAASSLTDHLRGIAERGRTAPIPGEEALSRGVGELEQVLDARFGGFGGVPKFPRSGEMLFLLREWARTGSERACEMVAATLGAMANGGIRDHLGGGFHRYSVDAMWRVPHFEKMLYDQAQLVLAFLEAAQATGDRSFAEVAADIVRYVHREMTDPSGGFCSAEDADSVPPGQAAVPGARKSEGAFYLWRDEEIAELAGGDAALVRAHFGIHPGGNAPEDPHGEFTSQNLLYIARPVDQLSRETGREAGDIAAALARVRARMFERQRTRPRPYLDDKVLAAWNGLMIAALARAARVLPAFGIEGDLPASCLDSARRAVRFIRTAMWDQQGARLLRRYRDGQAAVDAYAEDYACLVFGLLELFQSDADPGWFEWARELQRRQNDLFWDEADGGWFSTTGEDPSVLLRLKEDYDGAEPSANSLSVWNLITLAHLDVDGAWREMAERAFAHFATRLSTASRAVPMMMAALSAWTAGVQQVVIAGPVERGDTRRLLAALNRRYLPFAVQIAFDPASTRGLEAPLPFVGDMSLRGGQATAYVCRDFTCAAPTTDAEVMLQLLGGSGHVSPSCRQFD
jgi:uncharacterized protein YyaL (SSP411 family)